MPSLLEPFTADFVLRALVGGALAAVICGIVGTWVVVRGMAFLGEAIGHGMLPGVAIATVAGAPVMLGGAVSAVVMSALIGALQRRGRLSADTSIGLLFVAMLALGVIIVSHSRSFATDATAMLFGDILALSPADLVALAVAAVITVLMATILHRSFVAVAFDARIAQTLGLHPRLAQLALVGLVTLAVVSSYQAVGSLLVVGLLLAPAVAAGPWTRRIATRMLLAIGFGICAVVGGLIGSWHLSTAAGASIAGAAILLALISSAVSALRGVLRASKASRARVAASAIAAPLVAVSLVACAGPSSDAPLDSSAGHGAVHGAVAGAEEVAEPQLRLVALDGNGAASMLDLLDGDVSDLDPVESPSRVTTDGRYVHAAREDGVDILDSGVWTWDHVDHFHYYRAESRALGTVPGRGVAEVSTGLLSTAGSTGLFFPESGEAVLLDNHALSNGEVVETLRLDATSGPGVMTPLGDGAVLADAEGARIIEADGATGASIPCAHPSGSITTRVGAVIGCESGAVLATVDAAGDSALELVEYPVDATGADADAGAAAPAPATSFTARKGRPTVAGLGTDAGVWLLDTRAKEWDWIPSDTALLAAAAVDDEAEHVVTVGIDGVVRVVSGATGALLAATEALLTETIADGDGDPARLAPVTLTVDASRAYVNAPSEGVVYEIDFADSARIARVLEPGVQPVHLVEVGQ